ncbi:hypothetical protein VO418_001702 [Vibrio cholerae]|nr:hypothetical protein [Vibrio cholerae]EMC9386117.1 hypothetical protein [Vibrio cholerae]
MAYSYKTINSAEEVIPFFLEFMMQNPSLPFESVTFGSPADSFGVIHRNHQYMYLWHNRYQHYQFRGNWVTGSPHPGWFKTDSGASTGSIPFPCVMHIMANDNSFVINFFNALNNTCRLLGVQGITCIKTGQFWGAIGSGPGFSRWESSFFHSVESDGSFTGAYGLAFDSITSNYITCGRDGYGGLLPQIRYARSYGYPCVYPDTLHLYVFEQSATTLFMPSLAIMDNKLIGEYPDMRTLCTKYFGNGDIQRYQDSDWVIFTQRDAGGKEPQPRGFAFRV